MFRIAVIDLGTVSIRFDVYQITAHGHKRIHRERAMPDIGRGLASSGKLNPEGFEQALSLLSQYKKTAKDLNVSTIVAVGTSALRSSSDGEQFQRTVLEETGIELEIISGVREGQLTAKGILANETDLAGNTLLLDIGGGSTEISIAREKELLSTWSIEFGASTMQGHFLKTHPPSNGENAIADLRGQFRDALISNIPEIDFVPDNTLGSSGTVRTITRIKYESDTCDDPLYPEDIEAFIDRIQPLSKEEIMRELDVIEKRAGIILAGSLILSELISYFKVPSFRATRFSLRYGLLEEAKNTWRGA